jgi:hypothetical protein
MKTHNAIQIRHELARVDIEPDRWLVAKAPLDGRVEEMLERQQHVLRPVKVIAGPSLRAELPFKKKAETVFDWLWNALETGIAVIQNGEEPPGEHASPEQDVAVEECLIASGVDYTCSDDEFAFRTEELSGNVTARLADQHALFRTELVCLPDPQPVLRAALSHFVTLLNASFRLVRGSLTERAIELEVVTPVALLDPWMFEKVIGALSIGQRLAGKECAALLDPELARQYVEFHRLNLKQKGEKP